MSHFIHCSFRPSASPLDAFFYLFYTIFELNSRRKRVVSAFALGELRRDAISLVEAKYLVYKPGNRFSTAIVVDFLNLDSKFVKGRFF